MPICFVKEHGLRGSTTKVVMRRYFDMSFIPSRIHTHVYRALKIQDPDATITSPRSGKRFPSSHLQTPFKR